jgi:hypothetical protein
MYMRHDYGQDNLQGTWNVEHGVAHTEYHTSTSAGFSTIVFIVDNRSYGSRSA